MSTPAPFVSSFFALMWCALLLVFPPSSGAQVSLELTVMLVTVAFVSGLSHQFKNEFKRLWPVNSRIIFFGWGVGPWVIVCAYRLFNLPISKWLVYTSLFAWGVMLLAVLVYRSNQKVIKL